MPLFLVDLKETFIMEIKLYIRVKNNKEERWMNLDKITKKVNDNKIVVIGTLFISLTSLILNFGENLEKIILLLNGNQKKPVILSFEPQVEDDSVNSEFRNLFFKKSHEVKTFEGENSYTFAFTIENPNDKQILIDEIQFNVKEIGGWQGPGGGPLFSNYEYSLKLDYAEGLQRRKLKPKYTIEPNSISAFDLEVYIEEDEISLVWIMSIIIVTNSGKAETETFELILSNAEYYRSRSEKVLEEHLEEHIERIKEESEKVLQEVDQMDESLDKLLEEVDKKIEEEKNKEMEEEDKEIFI